MNKALTIFVLISLTSITNAANWIDVDHDESRTIQIDYDSLQNIGTTQTPIAKAWVKLTNFEDDAKNDFFKGEYVIGMHHYDCLKKKIRYLSFTTYDTQGKVKISQKHDSPIYEEVIPDSVGEDMLKGACTALKLKFKLNKFNI